MTSDAGYYLIASTGWGRLWHVVRGGPEYADWFRGRCGRSFDGEYAHNAPAGPIDVEDLCSRCARSIGAADGAGGILSLGEMPRARVSGG